MCLEDQVLTLIISFQVLVYILPNPRMLQVPEYEPPRAVDILIKIVWLKTCQRCSQEWCPIFII